MFTNFKVYGRKKCRELMIFSFVIILFIWSGSVSADQPESYSSESVDYDSSYDENPVCLDDEYNKTCCHSEEFQCGNGACISLDKVCQSNLRWITPIFRHHRFYYNNVDCSDFSDEMGCSTVPCSKREPKCPQLCLDLPSNKSRCTCYKGYAFYAGSDNVTCEDVDECALSLHSCSHDCINKNGTYSCACKDGYEQGNTASNNTCHIQDQSAVILYNVYNRIMSYNISSGRLKNVVRSGKVDNFDYDIANTIMYWSTKDLNNLEGIFRSYIPGAKNGSVTVGHSQAINFTDNNMVRGSLSIDWTAGTMYWMSTNIFNSSVANVMVSKLDGRYTKTLIGTISHPNGLVLDPEAGRMYWASGGDVPHIGTSFMNGMLRMLVVRLDNQNPVALTLDYLSVGRLYWADSISSTIYYVHVYSKRVTKVHTTIPPHTPATMDVFENNLYWLTRDTGEIFTMNKFGKGSMKKIIDDVEQGSFFKIYHDLKITANIRQNSLYCGSQCSHLCLHIPRGYSCTCPDGSQLVNREGEVVCDSEDLTPQEDPLDCNCNDIQRVCNESSPYSDCFCPCSASSQDGEKGLIKFPFYPTINLWISSAFLIAFAVLAVLFIAGVVLSFYRRGSSA